MFIRPKLNKKSGKTYYSMEERYREGKKVKSRYLYACDASGNRHFQTGEVQADRLHNEGYLRSVELQKEAPPAWSQEQFLAETQAPSEVAASSDKGGDGKSDEGGNAAGENSGAGDK